MFVRNATDKCCILKTIFLDYYVLRRLSFQALSSYNIPIIFYQDLESIWWGFSDLTVG